MATQNNLFWKENVEFYGNIRQRRETLLFLLIREGRTCSFVKDDEKPMRYDVQNLNIHDAYY